MMNQTQTRPRRASSKRPSRPKPKGNGQPTRTRRSLANGRTVEGGCEPRAGRPSLALHRALRRMAGLVFLLVFWVLAGAFQRHGVGGFLSRLPSTARSMMVGRVFLVLAGACQFGHGVGGFTTNSIHSGFYRVIPLLLFSPALAPR